MKRLASGLQVVLLMNVSMDPDAVDNRLRAAAQDEIHQLLDRTPNYPRIDLFDEFR
jgi:hypothetical protein